MQNREKIELSSIEATAYWWVNTIRHKIRELVTEGTKDKNEIKFIKIFYNYTEVEWRNLYLGLVGYITEDVNNYESIGNTIGIDAFSQDTNKNGHDRINTELSKITNCSIPDITLTSNSTKDSVIYTDMFGASIWYKSCSVTNLTTKYEPHYILTGDDKKLDFYNLLISTIAVLYELDKNFKSIPLLRKRFCKEYIRINNLEENLEDIIDMFNYSFEKACDNGMLLGKYWKDNYFAKFIDMDYIGLKEYMDIAEWYANIILYNASKKGYSHTRKRNLNNNDK